MSPVHTPAIFMTIDTSKLCSLGSGVGWIMLFRFVSLHSWLTSGWVCMTPLKVYFCRGQMFCTEPITGKYPSQQEQNRTCRGELSKKQNPIESPQLGLGSFYRAFALGRNSPCTEIVQSLGFTSLSILKEVQNG